jgi:hypothetical protein
MTISEILIKELVSSTLEESRLEVEESIRNHLREGDEDIDDTEENNTNDASSDVEDMGSNDSSGDTGGEGTETETVDSEKEIDKLSNNVSHGFSAPKNLTLNDGTQTHIAVDSEDQIGEIDQDEENYEVTFEKGNWDLFTQSAQQYSQKVTIIRQTLVPLVEKALIELLETSGAYDRTSFVSSAFFQNNDFRVVAELHYTVDLWLGEGFQQDAINQDQGYIYQTISAVPGIQIESVLIDTSKGDVQIIASV